jgi:hypothetical protein
MNILSLSIEHVLERLRIFLLIFIHRVILAIKLLDDAVVNVEQLLILLSFASATDQPCISLVRVLSIRLDVGHWRLLGMHDVELLLVLLAEQSEMVLPPLEVHSVELGDGGIWTNDLAVSQESPDLSESHSETLL